MRDIVAIEMGKDLRIGESVAPKARNVAKVQRGSLEYAPEFGSDMRYFLEAPVEFQTAALMAHIVESLAKNQIGVSEAKEVLEEFETKFEFLVSESTTTEGLVK